MANEPLRIMLSVRDMALAQALQAVARDDIEVCEHCLVQDDDGHWYVCPAERVKDFAAMDERTDGWEPWECPKWLVPVDGDPSLVRFVGYRIR